MDATLGLIILFEILVTLGIAYGILHEQALIRFENAVIARVRAAIKRRKMLKAQKNRQRFTQRVTYTPVKPGSAPRRSSNEAA